MPVISPLILVCLKKNYITATKAAKVAKKSESWKALSAKKIYSSPKLFIKRIVPHFWSSFICFFVLSGVKWEDWNLSVCTINRNLQPATI